MFGYKERKAAQVAAFFALKSNGSINVLKLAKLLYLAERESMRRFDEPLFYDKLVSMDHGPVASISLNNINGLIESPHWSEFIADRAGHEVGLVPGKGFADLDDLSKADLKILEDLWSTFGDYDRYALRDWTHNNCQEWENPCGSSEPIPHDRVFKFLGKNNADSLAEAVRAYRSIERALDVSC